MTYQPHQSEDATLKTATCCQGPRCNNCPETSAEMPAQDPGVMWDRFIVDMSQRDGIGYKNLIGSAAAFRKLFVLANAGVPACATCEGRGWMPVATRRCETCKGTAGMAMRVTADVQTRSDWEAWMVRAGRHSFGCYFSESQLELFEAWKAALATVGASIGASGKEKE